MSEEAHDDKSIFASTTPRNSVLKKSGAAAGGEEQEEEVIMIDIPLSTNTSIRAAATTAESKINQTTRPDSSNAEQPFPYWKKPDGRTMLLNLLFDFFTWGGYLGLGIPLNSLKIGGIVAGIASLLGLCLQYHRYYHQHTLRIFPKVQSFTFSIVWIIHGVFCIAVPQKTTQVKSSLLEIWSHLIYYLFFSHLF